MLPKLAAPGRGISEAWTILRLGDLGNNLLDHKINRFKPLMTRIEPVFIERMIEDSKEDSPPSRKSSRAWTDSSIEPIAPKSSMTISPNSIFASRASPRPSRVEKSDKLLQLTLDLGNETRNVFAGIASAYKPEDLDRQAGRHGSQPGASQDALRRFRGHGAVRR